MAGLGADDLQTKWRTKNGNFTTPTAKVNLRNVTESFSKSILNVPQNTEAMGPGRASQRAPCVCGREAHSLGPKAQKEGA